MHCPIFTVLHTPYMHAQSSHNLHLCSFGSNTHVHVHVACILAVAIHFCECEYMTHVRVHDTFKLYFHRILTKSVAKSICATAQSFLQILKPKLLDLFMVLLNVMLVKRD